MKNILLVFCDKNNFFYLSPIITTLFVVYEKTRSGSYPKSILENLFIQILIFNQNNKRKKIVIKMNSESLLELDGSLYEGGGQVFYLNFKNMNYEKILRNSMALSNILKKPFFIKNIRKNRPKPGLNYQLLSAVNKMILIEEFT